MVGKAYGGYRQWLSQVCEKGILCINDNKFSVNVVTET